MDKTGKSKYKGVYSEIRHGKCLRWYAQKQHDNKKYRKCFETEREAAVGYDKMCLSFGLEPVKFLKGR